jgi:hypothetical protein
MKPNRNKEFQGSIEQLEVFFVPANFMVEFALLFFHIPKSLAGKGGEPLVNTAQFRSC